MQPPSAQLPFNIVRTLENARARSTPLCTREGVSMNVNTRDTRPHECTTLRGHGRLQSRRRRATCQATQDRAAHRTPRVEQGGPEKRYCAPSQPFQPVQKGEGETPRRIRAPWSACADSRRCTDGKDDILSSTTTSTPNDTTASTSSTRDPRHDEPPAKASEATC